MQISIMRKIRITCIICIVGKICILRKICILGKICRSELKACLNEPKDEPWHAEEVEDKCILCIIYNNITCRDMSYLIVLQQNIFHVC